MCEFVIAWLGTCTDESIEDSLYCQKHIEIKCVHCGEQAVRQSDTTYMGIGAGSMLCDHERCNEMDRDIVAYFAERTSFFKTQAEKTFDEQYYEGLQFDATHRAKYYETYHFEEDRIISSLGRSVLNHSTPENVLEVAQEILNQSFANPKVQEYADKEKRSARLLQQLKQF